MTKNIFDDQTTLTFVNDRRFHINLESLDYCYSIPGSQIKYIRTLTLATMVQELAPHEILEEGLRLAGFDLVRQENVCEATNLERFHGHYGSHPAVYAIIWNDLQTTANPTGRIVTEGRNGVRIDKFLSCLYFLSCYPCEYERAGSNFKMCEKTARKWGWYFAKKLQALKDEKIAWPARWDSLHVQAWMPHFFFSVDGVHCPINEPTHPYLTINPAYYSHKLTKTGLDYELALSIFTNRLVWVNEPFPAGRNDITVFREDSLLEKLPQGKRAIGDKGCQGEPELISATNPEDDPDLRALKARARVRQETFNSRIKNFKALRHQFRHGKTKHKIVFEAVCVICQYQLENGFPLFNV